MIFLVILLYFIIGVFLTTALGLEKERYSPTMVWFWPVIFPLFMAYVLGSKINSLFK